MADLADLLSQLESSKTDFRRSGGIATKRHLDKLELQTFNDIELLIRFHEALLFVRAFPQTESCLRKANKILRAFSNRVHAIERSGEDMTPFDYIEYSGISSTAVSGSFSYDIVRWLVDEHSPSVQIDWENSGSKDRLGQTLPRFVPLLYEDSLVEANVPYLEWIRSAAGKNDLAWLIRRFASLHLSNRQRAELFDSLGLRVRWSLGESSSSRTLNMNWPRKAFCHHKPLVKRSEVSLDREFQSVPIKLTPLPRAEGKKVQDMLRATTTVRYRELYGITHGDPNNVFRADIGRGVEIFLWDLPPERRLPLRAYHAGFTLKNGVPINYIEGISIFDRMEVGFNTFYTFREGESAWVYAKVLKLLNQIAGVTCISIDPYQLGFHNEEAIESGAFWFYRKLGFRPTRAEIERKMQDEEYKIAADRGYRTPSRVLRFLARGNAVYEAPGSTRGDWDRFAIRNVGLAVQSRMRRDFNGDADKMRSIATKQLAKILTVNPASREATRVAFQDFALVAVLIPDIEKWTVPELALLRRIIKAKYGKDESTYARLLQSHRRFRSAIINLGEAAS